MDISDGPDQWQDDQLEERYVTEEIGNLATALSALQGELTDAHKGSKGYGYNYADLATVLDIARPLLTKHGLAVSQLPGNADDNVSVKTVLMHKSGQFIESTISMPVEVGKGMSKAQAIGSVITYCRRYSLAAVLGIAQTDDDAHVDKNDKTEKNPYAASVGRISVSQAALDKIGKINTLEELDAAEKMLKGDYIELYRPYFSVRREELEST